MRVFLSENRNSLGIERQIDVAFNIAETLDESLDTGELTLSAEDRQSPYAPMSKITIYVDDLGVEKLIFYTVSDTVNLFSLNPLKYKHTLKVIQNTRLLSKYTARNSVFSQPASKYKQGYIGSYFTLSEATIEGDTNYATLIKLANTNELSRAEKLTINANEKIKDAFIEIDVQVGVKPQGDDTHATLQFPKTLAELNTYFTNPVKVDHLYLHFTLDGSTYRTSLSLSDVGGSWKFNQKIRCQEVLDKLLLGATDMFISCHDDGTYLDRCFFTNNNSGKFYPDDGITPAFFIIQFKVIAETYYHTAYDVLDLLIKRQKQENNTTSKTALFSLPASGELYDLLNNTVAPNFTFTQCTMFDCIAEVFKLYDATFTLNENNVLDIEYLNDNKTVTQNTDFSSLNISIAEDKFNNGFITYYQDARTLESFPANKNQYVKPRSLDLGVPDKNDHHLLTPHPIHNVIDLYLSSTIHAIRKYPGGTENYWTLNGNMSIDLSHNILQQSIWSLLSSNTNDSWTEVRQCNSFYFNPGDNKIQLAWSNKTALGLNFTSFGRAANYSLARMMNFNDSWISAGTRPSATSFGSNPEPSWEDVFLHINYETTVSGKSEIQSYVNKLDGDMYVNQDNGAVDLNKLGLNLLGLSLKLGEPTRQATKKIQNWSDRIIKGTYVLIDGEKWVANVCSYTFFNDKILENIEFVKNFNALSQRTRLLREKRFSNISQELIQKSEDIIVEYCYFSSSTITKNTDTKLLVEDKMFYYLIDGTFSGFNNEINFGTIDIPNYDNGYLPLIKYGFGNSICFEMSLDSPISIGNKTETSAGWWGATNYFTQAIKYTDDSGFKDTATIKLVSGVENASLNMPIVNNSQVGNSLVIIPNLKLYKQPNEIFALNYEVCFLPINKNTDFMGSAFINNNNAVSEFVSNKKFYLYYTTPASDFQYSVLDTKGELDAGSSRVKITSIYSVFLPAHKGNVTFNHAAILNIKTWAICDEEGNIYFASNNASNGTTTTKVVSFIFRHNRL